MIVLPQPHNKAPAPALPPSQQIERKWLPIALVASAVLLLVAIGVAAWLFVQKAGGNLIVTKLDPNSTVNVKSVSWVAPDQIPGGYAKFNQSTHDAEVVYYANESESCSVTTRVFVVSDASDLAETAAKANDSLGIQATTVAGEGSTRIAIKDAESDAQYDFASTEFDQSVNVPTLDYNAQSGAVYYKQFGNHLATVSFVCKLATFEVNAEDLVAVVKQFTVRTER